MNTGVWVALGGALGAVLRYLLDWLPLGVFPWDTLLVNTLGCLAIGWVAGRTAVDGPRPLPEQARQFLMTGVCGGFTTFSVFSLESVALLQAGAVLPALGYMLATVVLAVLAAGGGLALGRR
ncbi:fluoride efflux transporter FluC [Alkalilimnicola ehrlichii MLHE-1]|uniref:Fluoride-specific ion channel FluC n=1 Tax=Alkalilimnicola ehrlichii (strain ATCC BAA-1101 / DSM 17681 / MLHE-1) TaxID=187272 RepID=Q0AAG4_ALKEH|nr:CrcB family protein [Alkalilimnicola ehrlichii]ABI56173.1 camphor resistance protein CrcB [Alkalilimnicola ehrlichii MLHE-1]